MAIPVWLPFALKGGSLVASGIGNYLEGKNQESYSKRVMRMQEEASARRQEAEVFGEGRGQRYGGRDTLQSRLAQEETDRYGAATALEAERYETERGDYATEIARRDEQDRLQRQYEGLGAQRAIDALKQGDSTYAASEEEQALVNYLLRGGQGQVSDYLVPPVDTTPPGIDDFPKPIYTGNQQGAERDVYRRKPQPSSQYTKDIFI